MGITLRAPPLSRERPSLSSSLDLSPGVDIEFVHLVFCISPPVHIPVVYTMPHDVELCLCEEIVVAHMVWMAMGAHQVSHLNIKKVEIGALLD